MLHYCCSKNNRAFVRVAIVFVAFAWLVNLVGYYARSESLLCAFSAKQTLNAIKSSAIRLSASVPVPAAKLRVS